MGIIRAWTKQSTAVLGPLEETGRYAARGEGIFQCEDSRLMRRTYCWLALHMPQEHRPPDADFPVWLSFREDSTMLLSPGSCILELALDEALITRINVAKWGAINNFSYLPRDEADARRHSRQMEAMGLSDTQACMTRFYPAIRQEIEASWVRLFDDSVQLGGPSCYGLIWEVKAEWIKSIRQ